MKVRSTNATILLKRSEERRSGYAESGRSSPSASRRSTGWRGKGMRSGGSSRREQDSDGSGREDFLEPDVAIASAKMS